MVTVALFTNGCSSDDVQNRCISDYPNISHETLSYPSGSVANIEGIEWFEDGVKQITLKSRAVIMVRPLNLPLPAVGSKLELRSFIKNPGDAPFAGCYCQVGTDICLEEYTYP
ncbi:MAG: hypothetical protein HKP55_04035 [Gammaproteobacteria bacterium]|nr:hypothetical protein [Gammaproteobacteria bacterium]